LISAAQVFDSTDWREKALVSLGVIVGAVIIWFVSKWLLDRWVNRKAAKVEDGDLEGQASMQRLRTLAATLEKVFGIIVAASVIVYIMLIWGIPIAPLLAVGGAIGLAIGFGAQDLVKDFIAGFFVLVEDQYAIGDVVDIAGVSGTVEEIRIRTTVLRAHDGSVHHVPNGAVRVATNMTPEVAKVVIDLGVDYEADIDAAIAAIGDEAAQFRADPEWQRAHAGDPEVLGVNELADSAVVIRMSFTTAPEQRWAVKREFLRRVKYRLDDEGIELAYPHLQIIQGPNQD